MDFQVCQPQKTRVLCHLKQPLINGLRPENSARVFLLELDRGKLGTNLEITDQYAWHASSVTGTFRVTHVVLGPFSFGFN